MCHYTQRKDTSINVSFNKPMILLRSAREEENKQLKVNIAKLTCPRVQFKISRG